MAEIRCSNCGENNPDFFDTCQFCQSPLKSESTIQTGELPSEKDTDELEPILPEWLQDVRQQSRDTEEDETFSPETKPKIRSVEPVDLLAGLASQDDSEEDEVPDWLASINPLDDEKSVLLSDSDDEEKEETSDFFAQFSQIKEPEPSDTQADETAQMDTTPLTDDTESQEAGQTDELADWLSQSTAESSEPVSFGEFSSDAEDGSSTDELGVTEPLKDETPAEQESEDLSWLHDLEASSRQADEVPASEKETAFDIPAAQPESSDEDLSWLDNLGGVRASAAETPAQSESSDDDLSWLNNLGGTPTPAADEPVPAEAESSEEDLDWLDNLGGTPPPTEEESALAQTESAQEDLDWLKDLGEPSASAQEDPAALPQPESSEEDLDWMKNLGDTPPPTDEESRPAQTESAQEDLDWLKDLGDPSASAQEEPATLDQPESSEEDLSWMEILGDTPASETEEPALSETASSDDDLDWMKNLGEEPGSLEPETPSVEYTPAHTAPLDETAGQDSTPDWLKSAMEEPSMPAPGDLSMDWFTDMESEKETEAEATDEVQEIFDLHSDEASDLSVSEPASEATSLDLPFDDSSSTSQQDLDAMFDIDIPEVSQEGGGIEQSESVSADLSAAGDESLSPVDLPSWVQDMRPVDSAIAGTSTVEYDEQETESEGPLAGFSGVIPSAPIGSSLRPKAFSMKLQVTDEQQAGAELIEQIIASESAAPAAAPHAEIASQRMLRWILSAIFVIVLSLVIGIGSQSFSIVAPGRVSQLSDLIGAVPEGSPVLLVVDYQPAVAGELAAAAGPVLDQLALSRQSTFTFLSMSPNGSAMAEHLMANTNISSPLESGGLGYQPGVQYFNAGFLPGGSTGVLGFINDPVSIKPEALSLANVNSFSGFEAVILMTDNADSGRVWVEQLEIAKQAQPEIASKPLVVISSAQAGPLLEPYVSSGQANLLINGLSDAAKYEFVNQSRPGIARAYWDSFGVGLMIAVLSIILGSLWNIFTGVRERRAEAEQG
ncbi:MAG TPA: hypothetical protein VK851_05915 [Anaerolineales bacterium]|nr:hypothetical protein [Anaerolineales bacterium]